MEQPENIRYIKMTYAITYLGLVINNKWNCFKTKEKIQQKAVSMGNMIHPIIPQSCNKQLNGKV